MSSTTNWPLGSRVSIESVDPPKDGKGSKSNLPVKGLGDRRDSTYDRLSDSLQSRPRPEPNNVARPIDWLGSVSRSN